MASKQYVRRKAKQARLALDPSYRHRAGIRIAEHVLRLVKKQAARHVMLYAALEDEVPTEMLFCRLRKLGIDTSFPRIGHGNSLHVHVVSSWDDLRPAAFGIKEPHRALPRVEPTQLDVIVVPGVAFDHRGSRLGYGKGYYDRFLARIPHTLRIGLAFDCCVYERVPSELHDIPMHYVVTETQCIVSEM